MKVSFSITYVKHILAGIVRFRTIRGLYRAFLYIFFMWFRKVYFCVFVTFLN